VKLTHLRIQNFRACREITLEIGDMHALVGANNAGKSTMLLALDFLFNPSTKSLNGESFWNNNTTLEIRVEAVFSDLMPKEKETLKPYLKPDGTFHIARNARMGSKGDGTDLDTEEAEEKTGIVIGQYYEKPIPTLAWLQEGKINKENIERWWEYKNYLTAGGVSFADFLNGTKPSAIEWRQKAKDFLEANIDKIPTQDVWENISRRNVLKETLPFFVLVPAVRDVTEESKGTKSSPFGKLLQAILNGITCEKKTKIEGMLDEITKQMNRSNGGERIPLIASTEKELSELLSDFFSGCDLEIEFETPTLEFLLSSPKIYVNDGFRNVVENKGHGLQRAVIFTILRYYAKNMISKSEGKRNLILAVEEPEIYMHPQAQRTIRRVFRSIAEGGDQVIFSTHSSLFVDVANFDEIIRMEAVYEERDGKRTNKCTAWQLPMSKMIEDLVARNPNLKGKVTAESMRDLYSNAYNPRRNEGFFASKIILVEGLTEEYSLPIYADVLPECAFDPQGISVVECGGKGAMDRLFRIFNELHIPCYILFDYDNGSKEENNIKKSKELLALAGKPEDVSQSLRVEDSIACFPTTWESHLRTEIPDMDTLTAEARKYLGIDNSDSGKPLIAQYIARKITSQNPSFVPESLKIIIEKAVAVSWTGSCLKRQANMGITEK